MSTDQHEDSIPTEIAVARRRNEAMNMFIHGGITSYRELGERLGISATAAYQLIRDAAREDAAMRPDLADGTREILLQRYERLYQQAHKESERGDLKGTELAMKILDRMARMYGADTAASIEVNTTVVMQNRDHIDDDIAQLRDRYQQALERRAQIVDGSIEPHQQETP